MDEPGVLPLTPAEDISQCSFCTVRRGSASAELTLDARMVFEQVEVVPLDRKTQTTEPDNLLICQRA